MKNLIIASILLLSLSGRTQEIADMTQIPYGSTISFKSDLIIPAGVAAVNVPDRYFCLLVVPISADQRVIKAGSDFRVRVNIGTTGRADVQLFGKDLKYRGYIACLANEMYEFNKFLSLADAELKPAAPIPF